MKRPVSTFLFVAILFFSPSSCSSDTGWGFKDYILGSTTVEDIEEDGRFKCWRGPYDFICLANSSIYKETIANVEIDRLSMFFSDGTLSTISIYIKSSEFDRVVEALCSKYGESNPKYKDGPPKYKESEQMNVTLHWENADTPGQFISAEKYGGGVRKSEILFEDFRDRIQDKVPVKDSDDM